MQWEELVTDGHVNAAKMRASRPFILGLGLVIFLFGGALFGEYGQFDPASISLNKNEQQIETRREAIDRIFTSIKLPALDDNAKAKLAPAYELPIIAKEILSSLNDTGKLPETLPIVSVSKPEFWQFSGDVGKIQLLGVGKLKLISARVTDEQKQRRYNLRMPAGERLWIGVFRKGKDSKWRAYSLSGRIDGASLLSVEGTDRLNPASYPVTFEKLIPKALVKPSKKQKEG